MLLNVLDFPDSMVGGFDPLSAALLAATDGDRIYLPGGQAYVAPPGGWIVDKCIELFGDGPGNAYAPALQARGTILMPHSASTSDHVLVLTHKDPPPNVPQNSQSTLEGVYLHDFAIRTSGATREGGDGIRFVSIRTPNSPPQYPNGIDRKLTRSRIERVAVVNVGLNGFTFIGASAGNGAANNLLLANCCALQCGGWGCDLRLAFGILITGTRLAANSSGAVNLFTSELVLSGCVFEGVGSTGASALVAASDAQQLRIAACSFSQFASSPSGVALEIVDQAGPCIVSGCVFDAGAAVGAIGIRITTSLFTLGTVGLLTNRFVNVTTAIVANPTATLDRTYALHVWPQFGTPLQPGTGDGAAIVLPTIRGNATFGVPNVNDINVARVTAMQIPELMTNPIVNLQDGHLVYITDPTASPPVDKLRLYAGGMWHDVSLS